MTIKEIFLKLTSTTTPLGNESLMEPFLPNGYKEDFHGNYYYKIGKSTVMFTCHLDTADSGVAKKITHEIKGNIIETDGKTILGADDKAGAAVLIYMINNRIPGLYYFFLGEERGRVGSSALSKHIKANKSDELYKDINKVVSFDRSDTYSVITYQSSERCCSNKFADDLAKELNDAGEGLNFRKDPTGLYTDSYSFIDIYPECTNLSVGYKNQHMVRENQDIEFLQRLADAALKVKWESLTIERDPTKTEYQTYGGSYYRGGGYNRAAAYGYGNSEWDDEENWWSGRNAPTVGPTRFQSNDFYIKDYLGDNVKKSDAVWCEFDKVYCLKDDAIWVDYVGFYTPPDIDPNKIKIEDGDKLDLRPLTEEDIAIGLDVYMNNKLYGKITEIDEDDGIHIPHHTGQTKLIFPINKIMKSNFFIKKNNLFPGETDKSTKLGDKLVTMDNIRPNMILNHSSFGVGKVLEIRPDRTIAKISFKNNGEKSIRIDVAGMKF